MKFRLLLPITLIMCGLLVPTLLASTNDTEIWIQDNDDGFGTADNKAVQALSSFAGYLYAGTRNESGSGAQLWRKTRTGDWSNVSDNGFGDSDNFLIGELYVFADQLYAGTSNQVDGGQVWRSPDGINWTQVTLPSFDPANAEIVQFAEYQGLIYATTWSYTDAHGAEIWRSETGDSGAWQQVVSNGFNGDVHNDKIVYLGVYNNKLFAGTDNIVTGAELWSTENGTDWMQVNADGFGDPANWSVTLAEFAGYLYAGTYNYTDSDNPGHELWRCQLCDGSDWQQVAIEKGFGDSENRAIRGLVVFADKLYGVTYNRATGVQVWSSTDGLSWMPSNGNGFGDPANLVVQWNNSLLRAGSSLYVGTWNDDTGGQIWRINQYEIALPLILGQ